MNRLLGVNETAKNDEKLFTFMFANTGAPYSSPVTL